jgi:hypothetical protein
MKTLLALAAVALAARAAAAQEDPDKQLQGLKEKFERSVKDLEEKFAAERARLEQEFKAAREKLFGGKSGEKAPAKKKIEEEKRFEFKVEVPRNLDAVLDKVMARLSEVEKRLETLSKEAPGRFHEFAPDVRKRFEESMKRAREGFKDGQRFWFQFRDEPFKEQPKKEEPKKEKSLPPGLQKKFEFKGELDEATRKAIEDAVQKALESLKKAVPGERKKE